jgi:hypothetical protein
MSAAGTRLRPATGASRWRVDPARSELALTGSVMGAPWLDVLLRGLTGSLLLDAEEPSGSSFELTVSGAGLYVGDPFLNSRLRLEDTVADEHVWLSGVLADGVLPGEHEATVWHNLAGMPSPARMAVELSRWDVRSCTRAAPLELAATRVSVAARQLEGRERLALHLEAVLDQDALAPRGA